MFTRVNLILILTFTIEVVLSQNLRGSNPFEKCFENISNCNCYDLFQITPDKSFDGTDIKQLKRLYKLTIQKIHPDKVAFDKTKDSRVIMDMTTKCLEIFKSNKLSKKYYADFDFLKKGNLNHTQINDMLFSRYFNKTQQTIILNTNDKDKDTDEYMLLFLDNSMSMSGARIKEAQEIFLDISARFFRHPTKVYLLGPSDGNYKSEYLQDILQTTDLDNILNSWTGTGPGSYLWEFMCKESLSIFKLQKNLKDILIITDGEDNHSKGNFLGMDGLNAFMD